MTEWQRPIFPGSTVHVHHLNTRTLVFIKSEDATRNAAVIHQYEPVIVNVLVHGYLLLRKNPRGHDALRDDPADESGSQGYCDGRFGAHWFSMHLLTFAHRLCQNHPRSQPHMTKTCALATAVALLTPGWAGAEILNQSAGGFTVKVTMNIHATPDDVYRRIVRNVGDWWNPAHTFSGDAHYLTIDPRAMGCFCEKLPNLGSVRHMEVVMAAPGEKLVMIGALGPFQSLAVTGSMTIQLTPSEGGVKLELTYAVAGYLPAGMNTWAAPVDGMLTEQVTRLKNYVEHGDPALKEDRPKQP